MTGEGTERRDAAAVLKTPSACWLLATICTWSLLNIFPNFLLLFKKKTQITARMFLQTESGCSAGMKICQLCSLAQIPPHLYYQSRTWREWKEGLHCVRVPGNQQIEHNELHCTFSQKPILFIMLYTQFYNWKWDHKALQYGGKLTVCVFY